MYKHGYGCLSMMWKRTMAIYKRMFPDEYYQIEAVCRTCSDETVRISEPMQFNIRLFNTPDDMTRYLADRIREDVQACAGSPVRWIESIRIDGCRWK
jgi:hypothetical protein